MDDGLDELLAAEQIQPGDSLIGWAHAFADAVLSENEVPVDLLDLLGAGGGLDRSSPHTQPGTPHPAVAAQLTGIPRDADDPGSRPLGRDEGSGLRVIASQNIATRNANEGSGLRVLPPIPTREGSGLRAMPTREGSGLHALPTPPPEDEPDDDELEMLDADELEMVEDEEGDEDGGDAAARAAERDAEPEWKRALDDAQSGVLPLPQPPADEPDDDDARDDEPERA
jgi:hypothetical protein